MKARYIQVGELTNLCHRFFNDARLWLLDSCHNGAFRGISRFFFFALLSC
jgi:hypothetical protein